MEKVKITIEYNGNVHEMEAEAIMGYVTKVYDPEIGEENDSSFLIGKGKASEILMHSASAFGSIVSSACDDSLESILLASFMAKRLIDVASGEDDSIKILESINNSKVTE